MKLVTNNQNSKPKPSNNSKQVDIKNVVKEQAKQVVTKKTQPQMDEKIQVEVKKLEEALSTLGIYYNDEENKKAILDYSKAVSNFKTMLEKQKRHYEALKQYENQDETALAHIENLDKSWVEISNYFESLMSFFINPPSREIFDLLNYSTLLKDVYQSFKDYSKKLNELRIGDQFDLNKNRFEAHLAEIENFEKSVNAKLENTTQIYDNFLNNFTNKQMEKIKNFNEKSAELVKSYDDFLNKKLKFVKGGVYGLVCLNIVFAIVLGILVALCFVKYNELNDLAFISKQLDSVRVIGNEEEFIFEFPNSVKIVDDKENSVKKVIIKN